jgi:hypothetical protein
MLERPNIQSVGFRNIYQGGKAIGFQVPLRSTYYRGVFLSQIQKTFEVKVDGETFKEDQIKMSTGGKTYEQKDFNKYPDVYWPIYEPCILIVNKPGGLSLGPHEVECGYANTVCYTSPETDLQWKSYKRKMTVAR